MGPFAPPPPPGAQPPPLWGSEEHLRELFGERVRARARCERDVLEVTAFERPHDYGEHFKARYGPTIAARANAARTAARPSSTRRWTRSATSGTAAPRTARGSRWSRSPSAHAPDDSVAASAVAWRQRPRRLAPTGSLLT